MARKPRELLCIERDLHKLRKRIEALAAKGVDVEIVKQAITDLSTNVDALIASKAAGTIGTGITTEEAAAIADGLAAISNRIKAALPAA